METVVWATGWSERLLAQPGFEQILVAAGTVVAKGAKRRCPVSPDGSNGKPPGTLRDSIELQPGRDAAGPFMKVVATAESPTGRRYGLDVELGTRPHIIESHGSWPLRDQHGKVFGRTVQHPGTTAQPFLRPAVDDLAGWVIR